jgi:hypothetical protein
MDAATDGVIDFTGTPEHAFAGKFIPDEAQQALVHLFLAAKEPRDDLRKTHFRRADSHLQDYENSLDGLEQEAEAGKRRPLHPSYRALLGLIAHHMSALEDPQAEAADKKEALSRLLPLYVHGAQERGQPIEPALVEAAVQALHGHAFRVRRAGQPAETLQKDSFGYRR